MNNFRKITSNYTDINSFIKKIEKDFFDILDTNIKRVRSTNLNKRINVVREIVEENFNDVFENIEKEFHTENSTIDNAYDEGLVKNINELRTLYINPIKEQLVNLGCQRLVDVYELRLEKETTDLDIFVFTMNFVAEQEKELIECAKKVRKEIIDNNNLSLQDITEWQNMHIEDFCGDNPIWRFNLRDRLNYNYSYFLKKNGFEYYLMFIENPVKELFRNIIMDKTKKILLNI